MDIASYNSTLVLKLIKGEIKLYNILLVCSAGMSTSLLVAKMEKAAEEQGIEVKVKAVAETDLQGNLDGVQAVLLGPQVRYMLTKVKAVAEPKGIPVDVISSVDYGMMKGESVLKYAISMIEGR